MTSEMKIDVPFGTIPRLMAHYVKNSNGHSNIAYPLADLLSRWDDTNIVQSIFGFTHVTDSSQQWSARHRLLTDGVLEVDIIFNHEFAFVDEGGNENNLHRSDLCYSGVFRYDGIADTALLNRCVEILGPHWEKAVTAFMHLSGFPMELSNELREYRDAFTVSLE
jgi:hypothetical protein